MEINLKSIKHEDFKDNESLEAMVAELNKNGANVTLGVLDDVINWGRSNSLWPVTFGTSCCGIEFMAVGAARHDMARFGFEVTRASPRQADMIVVAGTIVPKMASVFRRLYDQLAEPKYVVAVGACTISGGPFKGSYHIVEGIDKIVPVDVYVPGCPPRPESFLYGMMQLQRKVKAERYFAKGGRYVKESQENNQD
ncbi:MAG: NADH-quinone oxidoreductase subunit B [Flavobacteriales bacterium]|jgi:NADH-quinone oxidoreductase subunit B|nr:NADH-quinone oxidoreductase subunit B [Flavobacteriales bacterium]MBQ1968366.1 NADH-quinone oxidoreductase subunit B [Flavobacteriales bacterium]MBQ2421861.1 NADH-quinone oxidoreductase subunit B [Flavobacteriales bacterium]MBQ5814909.1 NADH-quinone oxidoreductase subunit B [Flavobacteriales bacterium]